MWNDFLTAWIIPGLGIAVLMFCLLSYFFPYGERFKDMVQKIDLQVVKLEVSVLTLFVLVGLAMTLSVFYKEKEDLKTLKEHVQKDENIIERLRDNDITVDALLEGVTSDSEMPKVGEVNCYFWTDNSKHNCTVSESSNALALALHFEQIDPAVTMESVAIEEKYDASSQRPHRGWSISYYRPFRPKVTLTAQTLK